jgi:hypothetical protein
VRLVQQDLKAQTSTLSAPLQQLEIFQALATMSMTPISLRPMEIFMFGTVIPGTTLARSLALKVKQEQLALLVQPVRQAQ